MYDPESVLLAYVKWYDQRGGGIETEIKEARQGLGLGSRNKKRYEAQQMVILLGALAHNVAVWSRKWLSESQPHYQSYGIQRLVSDLFTSRYAIWLDSVGHITQIMLNQFDPFAAKLIKAFVRYWPVSK